MMANTYSQLNIHGIFAVKYRQSLIDSSFRDDLHRYMSSIIDRQGAYPLAVGGWIDHVHIFFELPVAMNVSDLVRAVKASSSKWINENKLSGKHFAWQGGYGAFSYSRSQRERVINYIMRQEEHHRKKSFKKEYLEMLSKFEIKHDPAYHFDFLE